MTIDVLPTLANVTKSQLPKLSIDGRDIWQLIQGKSIDDKPYFAYYNKNELQAVIFGKWKLVFPHTYRTIPEGTVVRNDGIPVKYINLKLEKTELFDLSNDLGETTDLSAQFPEILAKMNESAEIARKDHGDSLTGNEGSGNRKAGRIEE